MKLEELNEKFKEHEEQLRHLHENEPTAMRKVFFNSFVEMTDGIRERLPDDVPNRYDTAWGKIMQDLIGFLPPEITWLYFKVRSGSA